MRALRPILLVLLVCLAVTAVRPAAAQPAAPASTSAPLTLAQALELALARNRDLMVSRRDLEVSRGRLRQARTYPLNPELIVDGDAGRAKGRGDDNDRRGVGGGSIGISQAIEIRGQRGLRERGAESEVARSEWLLRDGERQVVADTTRAFGDLLVAQERLGLAQDAVALATRLKETADTLAQAGSVPELDALRAEVELRRASNRVTLDGASVGTATRSLAFLTGAPAQAELRASGPLLLDPVPGSLDELLATARVQRPDVKAAEAAVASATASVALVRAERFLPAVTASVSYGEAVDFDSTNRRVLFGLSVPLPLWNRREGDLAAAEAEVRKQEALRDGLLAQIEREVATAYQQFAAAQRVVDDLLRRIVPAQEQAAALMQEGYRLGQFRLTEALQAQRDLVDGRAGYLEAVAAYNGAAVELRKALGVRQ